MIAELKSSNGRCVMKHIFVIVIFSIVFTLISGCNVSDEVDKMLDSSSSSGISSSAGNSSTVSSASHSYSEWSPNCPKPLTYRVTIPDSTTEYHQCVVNKNEFYNLKVITTLNTQVKEEYYLVLKRAQDRVNQYESQKVRSTLTDLSTNIMRQDLRFVIYINRDKSISDYWTSEPQHSMFWHYNGYKAEEVVFENRLDPDNIYRFVMREHRFWYVDNGNLKTEAYSVYKQNSNGFWKAIPTKQEEWYLSGNQYSRDIFTNRQNDNGEWVYLYDSQIIWYDSSSNQKKEESAFAQVKYKGVWRSYTETKTTWCKNGKVSGDFVGHVTMTDKKFDILLSGPTYGCNN